MFDLVRKLRHKEDDPSKRTSASQVPSADDGSQAGDWRSLQEIAYHCGWALFWAHSCDSALSVLSHYTIPVVICDRDLPGEDWRRVLKRIAVFRQPICILLASSVSDEYLWREVVQHQGFDVVPKPFQPERLIRTVNLAWAWEGWIERQPDNTGGR
jgi:DNA-binding NtrC family response regulator